MGTGLDVNRQCTDGSELPRQALATDRLTVVIQNYMGDHKGWTPSVIPSMGHTHVKEHTKGSCAMGVNSAVDLELLEEIYWAQRKISQVRGYSILL